MSQSLSERMAALRAQQESVANDTNTATEVSIEQEAGTFVISEAEIKKNKAYNVVIDSSKSFDQRVDALMALRAFNSELSAEENAQNLEEIDQLLIYLENGVMAAAQEGNEFTNDDALSLFDDMVKSLQDRLVNFNGYIKPFVKAFGVMKKARDAGQPPHELLGMVQDLKDKGKSLAADKAAKEAEIAAAKEAIAPIQNEASDVINKVTAYEQQKSDAETAKADAEALLETEKGKVGFFNRNKAGIAAAEAAIESATRKITSAENAIKTLSGPADIATKKLQQNEQAIAALESELAEISVQLTATETELTQDEDIVAIGRLIDITGEAFKGERDKLVQLVKSINTDSVADIEKTATRFKSGQQELNKASDKVENIGYFNRIVFEASKKAKAKDDAYAAELDTKMNDIKEKKGDDAKFDPDFEIAEKQKRTLDKHDRTAANYTNQAGQINGLIADTQTGFTATAEGYRQKEQDCRRLRTTTSVKTSTQTMTIMKALELATASERLAATDDIMSEVSATSKEAYTQIFEQVADNLTGENERLMAEIKKSIEAAEEIERFTLDIATKSREAELARRALHEAQANSEKNAAELAGVSAKVAREVASSDNLDEEVLQTAARAYSAPDNDGGPA